MKFKDCIFLQPSTSLGAGPAKTNPIVALAAQPTPVASAVAEAAGGRGG